MLQKKRGIFIAIWLTFHLGIPALLGLSLFFAPPLRLSTQLLDLFPQEDMQKINEADNILAEKNSQEAVILFASPVFEKAKDTAISFYNEFKDSKDVESASLFFDSDTIAEYSEYFYKSRFVIAGKNTVDLLESGNAGEIATDALASVYGAFNYIPLTHIDKDPFLLTERRMKDFLSSSLLAGGNLGMKEDVLSAQMDGIWYVLLRMTLSSQAVSVTGISNSVIREFYSSAASIKNTDPEMQLFFSGFPFHSYESASNAQKEIAILSTISMVFILVLLLIIFRSLIPIILSILNLSISLGLSTAAVFLFFREIHVFTFIFGTTLMGLCIDYSIHFFVSWRGNASLKNGSAIRSSISKSLIMCFISSALAFIVILFTTLPILKQFSIFTIVGLFSSFLTTYCIYPLLKVPDEQQRHFKFLEKIKISLPPVFRIISISVLIVFLIIIIFINPQGMKINNNLSSLYTMSPFLEESERKSAMVMGQGSSPMYFIVSGSSAEETLENEEKLTLRLEEEITRGNLGSFMGTTMFVPSIEYQKRTYKAMNALLPLAGLQYESLGFPPEYQEIFYKEYAEGETYISPEDANFRTEISNFWIGEVNGYYYSCVFLFQAQNSGIFKSIANEHDSVYLINKEEDINRDLNVITRNIILLFIISYFIIAVINFIIYPLKKSIILFITPALGIISVLAFMAIRKIPFGFLSISALVLVFGLGMDYNIFLSGGENAKYQKLTRLAVFLSFITSAVSFGILSFSSFAPVSILGFNVAVGLTTVFIFTMLFQGMADD